MAGHLQKSVSSTEERKIIKTLILLAVNKHSAKHPPDPSQGRRPDTRCLSGSLPCDSASKIDSSLKSFHFVGSWWRITFISYLHKGAEDVSDSWVLQVRSQFVNHLPRGLSEFWTRCTAGAALRLVAKYLRFCWGGVVVQRQLSLTLLLTLPHALYVRTRIPDLESTGTHQNLVTQAYKAKRTWRSCL